MSKSKKLRKTNRRFSRIKSKKTRKIRGGNNEDGLTLVGFLNDGGPYIPIYLFNNAEYNPRKDFILSSFNYNRNMETITKHVILPQLYKIKKMRGINLLTSLKNNNMSFYDENGNIIMNNKILPVENTHIYWNNVPKNKDLIRDVELKYPGLFQRIFVTSEEEQHALLEKEQEKEQQEQKGKEEKGNEENQEIQDIKKTLKEIQIKVNGKEEDEEKLATYAREMETTNEMIPYLNAEEKTKKGSKIAKKKYYNTYFTQDY
jgi:hypothetical protein